MNINGQATTEYILMLSIVVSFYFLLTAGLSRLGLDQALLKIFTGSYYAVYRYGHPKAKGYDDGGPIYHPMAQTGENSFRIFLNSQIQ